MGKLKIDDSEDMEVIEPPKAPNELDAEVDLDRRPRLNSPIHRILNFKNKIFK